MSRIKLAGAAWSWVGTTLAEAAGIYRAIGVEAMDLIAIPETHLDPDKIAADPKGQADLVKDLDITLSNLLILFGKDFDDRALNSADPAVRQNNLETFKNILEYCKRANVYSVLVLPGVEQADHSREDSIKWASEELNRMNALAKEAGVLLVYEPHTASVLENPPDIIAFAKQNSDVKLVLDHSHYLWRGFTFSDIDPIVPYAGHVHLRQGNDKAIQARWEDGSIDYATVISQLKDNNYEGYVALEYEHEKFWDMDHCDVMTESVKMRDAVLPLIS